MINISDAEWQQYVKNSDDAGFIRRYSVYENQQRFMSEIISSLPEKSVVVEIGVCGGMTASFFVQAGKGKIDYYGIDNWSLDLSYSEVSAKLDKLNLPYNLIQSKSSEVDWKGGTIDFLFIDGGHEESCVRPDCEIWIPRVKKGGYVAFHDWDGCKDASITPHWAVTHYGDMHTKGWKEVARMGNQLMIRQNI